MDKVENFDLRGYSSELRSAVQDASRSSVGSRYSKPRGGYSSFDIFQWLSRESQEAFSLASRRIIMPTAAESIRSPNRLMTCTG